MANKPRNNPFASGFNAVRMHTDGACCDGYLAVFAYEVAGGGANLTITPITGNEASGLKFYRVTVYDQFGNAATGALDLNNPTAPFIIDTSNLDASGAWVIKFAGCADAGELTYSLTINSIANNPKGETTPANYQNVYLVPQHTGAAADFAFPIGLKLYDGDLLDLDLYAQNPINIGDANTVEFVAKKDFYNIIATDVDGLTTPATFPAALPYNVGSLSFGDVILPNTYFLPVQLDYTGDGLQISITITVKITIA